MPHAVNYDETDYIKDAWSILQHGVEWNPIANPAGYPPGQSYADNLLLSGGTHILAPCSGYSCGEAVTHPEVGKYLIAIGEWVFGLNPFGYRVASAVFGSLAILLMCRIARRLTRSTLLGCIAGVLLSLDGMEFVLMNRPSREPHPLLRFRRAAPLWSCAGEHAADGERIVRVAAEADRLAAFLPPPGQQASSRSQPLVLISIARPLRASARSAARYSPSKSALRYPPWLAGQYLAA